MEKKNLMGRSAAYISLEIKLCRKAFNKIYAISHKYEKHSFFNLNWFTLIPTFIDILKKGCMRKIIVISTY